MKVFAGFDGHRAQITFDALDTETGEVVRGRIDSTPAAVQRWLVPGTRGARGGGGLHGLAICLPSA
jgi:hypothetical protein